MSDEATLLYLETDDEVTSVVRRLRETDADRVILVVPGRSRATSSAVALRLLARVGEDAGHRVAVVGDALTRSLATDAGLDTYASVGDARQAAPATVEVHARGASIHVVRGDVSKETAPVAAAPPKPKPKPKPESESEAVWTDADTQVRPVVVPHAIGRQLRHRPPVSRPRSARRALPTAAMLGIVVVMLVVAGALGAVLLPAATVAIMPGSEPLGPIPYEIRIDEAERMTGSVEASATVTATGTYAIQAAAVGTVAFRNFNTVDVAVGAGTLVAAGEQAFETTAEIVVPAGALTGAGTIQAGEEAVGVAASAIGPDANVPAEAIDTILTQSVAARLRGFPNNSQRLVLNPEATAGGVDTTGPEITQQDVDAALAALIQALDDALADELGGSGDAIIADPVEQPEPIIDGVDGLVEMRDQESAEISGTLAFDRLIIERDEVVSMAEQRLLDDPSALPDGHEAVLGATEVTIGEARRAADALVVSVNVSGASTPAIDRAEVIQRIRGRSIQEARDALAALGDATIELWPAWVASVPELEWRIDVEVADGQ